jgi:large subunit ribosomal protein L24
MPARIKTGDKVVVISGKDKGKEGEVLRVDRAKDKVFVQGLNIVKRHQKPQQTMQGMSGGGVIEKEGPIHISNVALVDPQDGKPTRVGIEVVDGKRVRVARRSGARID